MPNKTNFISRLPEAVVLAALAGMVGYLIHEATTETAMTFRMDSIEGRVGELERLHPRTNEPASLR